MCYHAFHNSIRLKKRNLAGVILGKRGRAMKKRICFIAMIAIFLLNVSPALADDGFYVIAGGGTSGKVLKTQVFTSNTPNTTLGTDVFTKLDSPKWTYTKLSATSYLVITYHDSLDCSPGYGGYLLRVNDSDCIGGWGAAMLLSTGAIGWNLSGVTGVWSGVPKGEVNLSIWHWQVNCTSCAQAAHYYPTTVTVMEIEH
jgi:hypothetical protein